MAVCSAAGKGGAIGLPVTKCGSGVHSGVFRPVNASAALGSVNFFCEKSISLGSSFKFYWVVTITDLARSSRIFWVKIWTLLRPDSLA